MPQIKNGKLIITLLLALSCVISGIILAASPSQQNYRINNTQQLDSLLNVHFQNAQIHPPQVHVTTIQVDTILTRKNYRIKIPSGFSKTLFHIDLHKGLYPYGIETPAKVHFPSRDMDIYIYNNETVLRKIRLTTDPGLDSLYTEGF